MAFAVFFGETEKPNVRVQKKEVVTVWKAVCEDCYFQFGGRISVISINKSGRFFDIRADSVKL